VRRCGFEHLAGANQVERLAPESVLVAGAIDALLDGNDSHHHLLPGAAGHRRIGVLQVRLGDLHIYRRLTERLILGLHDLGGGVLVIGAQTGAPAGFSVHIVIRISLASPH
jgi:hypothetical protein